MNRGFSLLEMLVAMTIAISIGLSVFQLFRQNESVFRDQEAIWEMQQSARAAAFQIASDLRLAGQGTPVFSATFDAVPGESTTVILEGSNATRINFRAGYSNVESEATTSLPLQLFQGVPRTITVLDAAPFSNAARYVYIWGPVGGELWGWARAALGTVIASAQSIQVTPLQTVQFTGPPRVSLEEAISIYFDSMTRTIRRTTATDMTNAIVPTWAPANELAANVTDLMFTYYDGADNPKSPDTLVNRNAVKRVDVRLDVQSAAPLQTGIRPTFTVQFRSVPGNLSSR